MLSAITLPLIIILSLVQVSWVNNWAWGGVVPNVLLAVLVVITIKSGRRTGLVWAFVGGLLVSVMAVYPFSGYLLALLVSIAVVGFLCESVFGTTTPLTLVWQAVIATVVFCLIKAGVAELTVVMWGTPVKVIWQIVIINMLWSVVYSIALVWLFYVSFNWIGDWYIRIRRRPGLRRKGLL
ncbi:hypothetical protein ACFL0Z_00330 [Patescibacteria group bacterium]